MKNINYRKAGVLLVAFFLLLYTLRLGYGFYRWPNGVVTVTNSNVANNDFNSSGDMNFGNDFGSKRNYASTKYMNNTVVTDATSVAPSAYDQKYEKVATVSSQSNKFEEDLASVKSIIKKYEGLIQYEQQSGLAENRYLHLAIGIPPDNFDDAVEGLKKIGKLTYIRIDKTDKTNEFQKLKASRAALEAQLASLIKLKTHEGKIEELMELEEKILSINSQLQSLGVSLGEFDSQNEFCTVKFTLREVKKDVESISNIPIYQRLYYAFTWTAKYYALLMFAFSVGMLGITFAQRIWNSLTSVFKQPE